MNNMKYVSIVLTAVISAVSCTKQIENENPGQVNGQEKGNLIINAVTGSLGKSGSNTKAVGSFGYDILWEENDRISVTDGSGNIGLFELIEGAGETLGMFQQKDGPTLSGTVNGYYPASILQDDGTILWPAEQTYSKELTGIPMTATATIADGGTNFNFKSLGGVLQLVLTHTEGDLPLKSITVSADNLETPITVNCQGLCIGASANNVNIALPANEYENMKLLFESSQGLVKTLTAASINIKRAVVSRVTFALSGFKGTYPDYLSFTARGTGVSVGIRRASGKPDPFAFEYCFDLASDQWTSFTADPSKDGVQSIVSIADGQTVFLRGKEARTSINKENAQWVFDFGNISNRVIASGNIMSLLDPEVKSSTVSDYAFKSLFKDAVQLVSAPGLPAMTLGVGCYSNMFNGCVNLTEAPELPAAYLSDSCYEYMFCNTGLISSALMYASSLAKECCQFMYENCSSLVSARPLTATSLAGSCYYSMFKGCESLIEAPMLPSLSLAESCYISMFYKCKSLRIPPALPALEMAESCYSGMFQGCASLVVAPELPAMTLATGCYDYMFADCTSLANAPELPATKMETMCYLFMFRNCSSLVKAPYLPASSLAENCYNHMFSGCTSLKSVSVNFTKWDTNNATAFWLSNVSSGGTFHCPSGLDASVRDRDHIPAGWTVITDATPSAIGDMYASAGMEGMYVGDINGKKLIFATRNYGADSMYDKGTSFTRAELDAFTPPNGWTLPIEDEMKVLVGNGFLSEFNEGTSREIGKSRYYIPYTHNVSGNMREGRLWFENAQGRYFYWFRSDNKNGITTDETASGNYVRLVKKL